MRLAHLGIVVALTNLILPTPSFATIQLSAGYNVLGEVSADFFTIRKQIRDQKTSVKVLPTDYDGALSESLVNNLTPLGDDASGAYGKAVASVQGRAVAQIGNLSASIVGNATAENFKDTISLEGVAAQAKFVESSVKAEWTDLAAVHVPSLANGDLVVVYHKVWLSGMATVSVSGGDNDRFGQAQAWAKVAINGVPVTNYGAYFEYALDSGPTNQRKTHQYVNYEVVPNEEGKKVGTITQIVSNGHEYIWSISLEAGGVAIADRLRGFGRGFPMEFPNASVDAHFNAEYGQTLTWGGITRVTTLDGTPIENWTVTSESGFDYSRPYQIPEPTSLLLIGLALCCSIGLRARRKSHRCM